MLDIIGKRRPAFILMVPRHLLLPNMGSGQRYMSCCGKMICSGCRHAPMYDNHGNIIAGDKCAFCRTPFPSSAKEVIERLKKRLEVGDEHAF